MALLRGGCYADDHEHAGKLAAVSRTCTDGGLGFLVYLNIGRRCEVLDHGLAALAAGVVALWGVSHLIPTRQVVAGFGKISVDNKRVLTMEWVAEGFTMLFAGALIAIVTFTAGPNDGTSIAVYAATSVLLAVIAVLTTLTAARTPIIWFKVCPVVMVLSIGLLIAGSVL